MDILASKLMNVFGFVGAAFVVVTFFGAVIMGITRLAHGPAYDATAQRLGCFWIFLFGVFMLLFFATMLLLDSLVWQKFNTIMMQKPNRLVISSEGKTNEMSDAAAIGELFQIVTHSKKVMAHHSHTVSEARLFFPESGYIYSLRRDSQYTNEYWFDWEGVSGRERDWLKADDSLGRLRSDELDRWVKKYAPPEGD